jgi:ribosomal protein S18 acetylase RimI-like enzyme
MSLEIRAVRPDEFEAVADLLVAAYEPFLGDNAEYMAVLRDTAARAEAAEVLVAVDERLLGTVTFVPHGGPLAEISAPDETEFRMLAVAPASQGRGVGTALMRHIVAASRGHRGIVCSSQATMTAAHRIYLRLGFRRVPERDWTPTPGVDLLAFALRI